MLGAQSVRCHVDMLCIVTNIQYGSRLFFDRAPTFFQNGFALSAASATLGFLFVSSPCVNVEKSSAEWRRGGVGDTAILFRGGGDARRRQDSALLGASTCQPTRRPLLRHYFSASKQIKQQLGSHQLLKVSFCRRVHKHDALGWSVPRARDRRSKE